MVRVTNSNIEHGMLDMKLFPRKIGKIVGCSNNIVDLKDPSALYALYSGQMVLQVDLPNKVFKWWGKAVERKKNKKGIMLYLF